MQQDNRHSPFIENNDYGQNNDIYSTKCCDLYGTARANFIKKVYSVLTIQLLFTVFFVLLSMYSDSFFAFQVQNMWFFYLAVVVTMVIQIYMFCCGGGRTVPSNYICLGLFTFCEAYLVSFISSMTGKQSGNSVVLMAGIYTLAITVSLTLYSCYTEEDFTTKYGLMLVLMVCLILLGFITMFTSSPFLQNLYCCVGVMVFGFYLVIDTQLIMGGKHFELSVDQYALGAMLLYIDIIQIFLYLLRLFGNKN